jgi:hypothetical protein
VYAGTCFPVPHEIIFELAQPEAYAIEEAPYQDNRSHAEDEDTASDAW